MTILEILGFIFTPAKLGHGGREAYTGGQQGRDNQDLHTCSKALSKLRLSFGTCQSEVVENANKVGTRVAEMWNCRYPIYSIPTSVGSFEKQGNIS